MLVRWIVLVASVIVPRDRRTEWRAEWEAELAHDARRRRRSRGLAGIMCHATGVMADALWLQTGQWRSLRFLARNWRVSARRCCRSDQWS